MKLTEAALKTIKDAIRKLPTDGSKEEEIAAFITNMAQIANVSADAGSKPRRAGRDRVQRQLVTVSLLANKLRKELEGLSAQTIQSMWDAPASSSLGADPARVDVTALISSILLQLRLLDHVARKANIPPLRHAFHGNTTNDKVHALTVISGYYYKRITNLEPDLSIRSDRFRALLRSIFEALHLDANVERATKDLIAKR